MNYDLNYEGFEAYLVEKHPKFDGMRYEFKFDNCYGASVIKNSESIGHYFDKWEMAVLRYPYDGARGYVDYDTEITDAVIGCLTDDEVKDFLQRIKEL